MVARPSALRPDALRFSVFRSVSRRCVPHHGRYMGGVLEVWMPSLFWRRVVPVLAATVAALPLTDAWAALAGGDGPIPVTLARVAHGDTDIVLTGLGTVQAWQSVTARAQVNGYLASIDFREGQTVHKGDLLASIDPRPYAAALAQAVAHRSSDQANLGNDQVNLRRDSVLAGRGYQTLQQADNDQALVREYAANIAADDAAVAAARLNLEFCQIRAPVDGVVGFRLVDIGNLIEASAETPIVSIQQVQPIAVVFTLPETDFGEVEAQLQRRTLAVQAFTADDRTLLDSGTVVAPDNAIATASGTIGLKAIFPNAQRRLWPGQFVRAHLVLRTETDTLSVPDDAIQHGPDGLYVYAVDANRTAHQTAITVGYDDGRSSVVRSGLAAGELVVASGQERVQDGTRVSPAKPPDAKPPDTKP